jgi:hypothetical protein
MTIAYAKIWRRWRRIIESNASPRHAQTSPTLDQKCADGKKIKVAFRALLTLNFNIVGG